MGSKEKAKSFSKKVVKVEFTIEDLELIYIALGLVREGSPLYEKQQRVKQRVGEIIDFSRRGAEKHA